MGSALAFWLGNPTLNPAVLVFLIFTLGWQWAALRLVLGGILVFATAVLATRIIRAPDSATGAQPVESTVSESPAESTVPAQWLRALGNYMDGFSHPSQEGNVLVRWFRSLFRLMVTLLPEYIVIVVILGAARAFLFPAVGPGLGNGLLVVIGLAIAGTLFVIPTAGEIPIIQTMMAYGLGVGPVGALLMTLAPVSLPSIAMVYSSFPKRVLVLSATATAVAGIVGGLVAMVFL